MLKAKTNLLQKACLFLIEKQVGDEKLWDKLTDQFRKRPDKTGEYRGEYWGKVMRGAALIYEYTQNEELYSVLERTVEKMLSLCTEEGITSYRAGDEFTGWDLWCRKYVAVGLEYFFSICKSEELKTEILRVLKTHLLAIAKHIGSEPGKKNIYDASNYWGGLNSCSILKAYVVAYELTGEEKLLDFARYIVSTGGSKDFDFIQAAKDDVPLCSYTYPKAYEATSFFEGLIEYGKLTGDEEILRACKNYGRSLLKEEYTVVGGGACACECFNYSAVSQTYPRVRPEQETCVTVSYMLYFNEMYDLTGESVYLDAMERSFFNAYLGALNETAPKKTVLPIDWYSPLVGGKRNNFVTAGRQRFSDGSFYSCCTAIGPAGAGVFARRSVEISENNVRFNFYDNRTVRLDDFSILEKTDYPVNGAVRLNFIGEKRKLTLTFRIPSWCKEYSLTINGKNADVLKENGVLTLTDALGGGDEVALDLKTEYGCEYRASSRFLGGFLTFHKGPVVYAADKRHTRILQPLPLISEHEPKFDFIYEPQKSSDCIDSVVVRYKNAELKLIDYASAGDTYDLDSSLNVFVPYRTRRIDNVIACFFDRRHRII